MGQQVDIESLNPCHAGHQFQRVGKTGLMRCTICDKVIYRDARENICRDKSISPD